MPIGDGQVMGRIRSFLTEPTFGNVAGMTPEDVARRRALAQALWSEGNNSEPVTSIFGGMNKMLQSFLGGRQLWEAENTDIAVRERERTAAEAEAARAEQQRVAGLNAMIDFGWPGQTGGAAAAGPVMTPGTPGFDGGAAMRQGRVNADNGTAPGTGTDAGIRMLDEFEGFRETPYEDWSYRSGSGERYLSGMRIGYGQDATGLPGQVTQEQAAAALRQQIDTQYVPSIVNDIGAARWSTLTPDQQGVLISLVHNYGSLPGRIVPALQSGDPAQAAAAIAALGGDNQGINQSRRQREAAYFAGPGEDQTTAAADPTGRFLRELAANPQMQPYIVPVIQAQIERLTTPPAPVDPVTVAQGTDLVTPTGELLYTNTPETAPGFRDLTDPAERAARGIAADDTRTVQVGPDNQLHFSPATTAGATAANLRTEIRQLQSYKNYSRSLPIYQSMLEAAGTNDRIADLNLVYGLATIFDPDSVVREGEQIMIRNAASLPEQVQGWIAAVNGDAGLGPELRAAVLDQAYSRVNAYANDYRSQLDFYGGIAERNGIAVEDLYAPLAELQRWSPGAAGAAAVPGTVPGAAAQPATGAGDVGVGETARGPNGEQLRFDGTNFVDAATGVPLYDAAGNPLGGR